MDRILLTCIQQISTPLLVVGNFNTSDRNDDYQILNRSILSVFPNILSVHVSGLCITSNDFNRCAIQTDKKVALSSTEPLTHRNYDRTKLSNERHLIA
jgi:hypothetical protein